MSDEEEESHGGNSENEEKEAELAFFNQKFDDDDIGIDDGIVLEESHIDREFSDEFVPEHMRGEMIDEEEDHLDALEKAIAKAKPKSDRDHPDAYQEALFGIEYEEEDLRAEFWKTPWLSPSTGVSATVRFNNMYKGGNATASTAKLTSKDALKNLGSAIPLYFQFSKIMSWCFIWMFILSLPALFLSFVGSRIPIEDQDQLGIYMFSIGNIGYDPASPTYAEDSYCSGNNTLGITEMLGLYSSDLIQLPAPIYPSIGRSINATNVTSSAHSNSNSTITCIHAFDMIELTQPEVSFILTTMEVLQVLVFMIGLIMLHSHTHKVHDTMEALASSDIGLVDYSIMVSNLPPGVTEEQLIHHFSNLYALDTIDFKFRPPVDEAEPVHHDNNSPLCEGTWVADCTIYRKIGLYFSAFRQKQALMEELYKCRAEMKMWAPETRLLNSLTGKSAADPKKYLRAEKRMIQAANALTKFSARFDKKMGRKPDPTPQFTDLETAGGSMRSSNSSKKSGRGFGSEKKDEKEEVLKPAVKDIVFPDIDKNKPAVCAFITFEYTESMARCVEDYRKYSSFPYNLCFPRKMKLFGYKLKVVQAPKPTDVIWENLEASWLKKTLRRSVTVVVCFVLVMVCFAIVNQAALYKQSFAEQIPATTLCDVEIPALYAHSYVTASYGNFTMLRPATTAQKAAFDAACDKAVPGSFYARYVFNNDFQQPIANYSVAACVNTSETSSVAGFTDGAVDVCPDPRAELTCPCVLSSSVSSSTSGQTSPCSNLKCYKDVDSAVTTDDFALTASYGVDPCSTFDAQAIGSCYCVSSLAALISSSSGFINTVTSVINEASAAGAVCGEFYMNYSLGLTLAYVAVIIIVLINQLLIRSLRFLSRFECHISGDDEQTALFFKIFFALFLNTGVMIIVAFGHIPSAPEAIKTFSLLTGPYGDFTVQWYAAIGQLFVLVVILQAIGPYFSTCWDFHCTKPWIRRFDYVKVNSHFSSKYSYQHQFDQVELGPCFSATGQSAVLLSLIFVAMAYAPGLPLMSFILMMICRNYYYTDRKLLCQYYQKAFKYGDSVMKIVVKLLPYAALLRLAIAAWMFTAPGVLYNSPLVSPMEPAAPTGDPKSEFSPPLFPHAYTRLNSANAKPLLVIFSVIVIIKLLRYCWRLLPLYWIWRVFTFIFKFLCGKRSAVVRPDANGYVHSFDLDQMHHPLRREQAPFSGDYFKYIPERSPYNDKEPVEAVVTGHCCGLCCVKTTTGLDIDEINAGWHYVKQDTHCIKVINWHQTIQIGDVVRHAGDRKRTYEVINQMGGISSYALDRIPAHSMSFIGFKDGTANKMAFQAARRADYHRPPSIRNLLYIVDKTEEVVSGYHKARAKLALEIKQANNWGLNVMELASTAGKKKHKKTKEEKEAEANNADGLYGGEGVVEEENQVLKLARMLKNGYESEESSEESDSDSDVSAQFRARDDTGDSDSSASDTSDEMALF